jgi:UDP-N-acetylmuramate--alanine ligase
MNALKNAFIRFGNKVSQNGSVVTCIDDNNIKIILSKIDKKQIHYGLSYRSEVRGTGHSYNGFNTIFTLYIEEKNFGKIKLPIPGLYNIKNALAAWAVARELRIDPEIIKNTLESIECPDRRFQVRGKFGELLVIEDYAHHPTAISQVLKAAKKGFSKKIIAVCQPHRYSRVKDTLNEFSSCFKYADVVFITDIYPASEEVIPNISSKILVNEISKSGHKNVNYIPDLDYIPDRLLEIISGDEIVIFLGAGDIYKIIDKFIELLKTRYLLEQKC